MPAVERFLVTVITALFSPAAAIQGIVGDAQATGQELSDTLQSAPLTEPAAGVTH